MLLADSSVESVTEDVAELKVKEPPASKAAPEPSTSAPQKHDEHEQEEQETEEDRAKREAELQKIYAELAKEDDRQALISYGNMSHMHACCLTYHMA